MMEDIFSFRPSGCGKQLSLLLYANVSAVQVISNSANLKMLNGEPLEAAITRDARHRNIVNTLDFAVTSSSGDADSDTTDMDSANAHHRGQHEGETWMILEFCDSGCLQVINLLSGMIDVPA